MNLTTMEPLKDVHPSLWSGVIIIGTLILSLLARLLIIAGLKRIDRQNQTVLHSIVRRTETASWWIFPLFGLLIALPAVSLPPSISSYLQHAVLLGLIAV